MVALIKHELALRPSRGHRRRTHRFLKDSPAMKARVTITLKNGVLDPQGKAIHHALEGLGFNGVNDVRAGIRSVMEKESELDTYIVIIYCLSGSIGKILETLCVVH